ncbi:MAG: response regulator [Opitutaceae bacterium]
MILVVEDKEAVRMVIKAVLERGGFRTLSASNGEEAAALWAESKGSISLLFTDVVLPGGVTGKDLADSLREERPDLKVVFCSGYGAEIVGQEIMCAPGNYFLAKPFDVQRLTQVVHEALAASKVVA